MRKQLLTALFLVIVISLSAQNDTLILSNGNMLVGEVKKMEKGVINIETTYSDKDFAIKWEEVDYIKTENKFIITLATGERISSRLESDSLDKKVINTLSRELGNKQIKAKQIVFLESFKDDFKSRISASFDVGSTFTKANNLRQGSLNAKFQYYSDSWKFRTNVNLVESSQDSVADIRRNQATLQFIYFLPKDFFLAGITDFLRNDELQLKLRSTYIAGVGYYINRSNRMYWSATTGLSYNIEKYLESTTDLRKTSELFLSTELNLFDFGDISFFVNATFFPNLTEKGRLRSDFKLDLKYDLPYDFYIKSGINLNYDSRSLLDSETQQYQKQTDYVIQTGFGWEF